MPVCENCGGNDFSCIDGMFYCLECDMQSQDIVEDQAPEVLGDGTFTSRALKKRMEKDKSRDFGRVWYTVEGYQLVVKAHIDALIRIGVNPAIDGVMKQIWFKYIHMTGMAVIDSSSKSEDIPDSKLSLRDYFFKYCSRDDAAVSMRKLKLRSSKKSKEEDRSHGDSDWLSVDTEASSDEDGALSSSSCPPTGRFTRSRLWSHVKVMSLDKVVAFCYLSILWMQELYTVGDLIHWAESGKIPYYDAAGCFPSDMKLYQGDDRNFVHARVLKYHEVVWMSRRLQQYIGMPKLPCVNILSLVGRYLYQLNLPLGFIPCAYRIVNVLEEGKWMKQNAKFRPDSELQALNLPDMIAASVIVILLKMCFVLDGEKEWSMDISQGACSSHGNSFENCVSFSWRRWIKQHLTHTSHCMDSNTLLDRRFEEENVDLHACMEHYLNLILKGFSRKTERVCNKKVNTKEFTEMRQFPFKRLVELQGSSELLDEKYYTRINSSTVKILGRRSQFSSGDLTSACVSSLVDDLSLRDDNCYMQYGHPIINDSFDFLPHSYVFVVQLLSDVTKAHWKLIHDYTVAAEEHILAITSVSKIV